MMSSLLFALVLITQVLAVKITTPNATTNWTSPGPNIISWTPGSADPATFSIQLAQHNVASFAPNLALPADGVFGSVIPTSALTTVFVPSCVADGARLPTGTGFTLRFFVVSADGSMALLATSQAFNITEADVTQCANLASTTSIGTGVPTMPGASASSAAATSSSTAAVASSGNLSTSSNPSHLGTIITSTLGALILLLLTSAAALWVYKARGDRRRKTAQFGLKFAQRIPQMQKQEWGQGREDV